MLIALDFDGTYTEDPGFWDLVIDAALYRGHRVICATMRHEHEGADVIAAMGKRGIEVIFTARAAKLPHLSDMGIQPDVWIDDQPAWIFEASR